MCQSNDTTSHPQQSAAADISYSQPSSTTDTVAGQRQQSHNLQILPLQVGEAYHPTKQTTEIADTEHTSSSTVVTEDNEQELLLLSEEEHMRAQISQQLHEQAVWWNEQLTALDSAVERIRFILQHANDLPTTVKDKDIPQLPQRVIQTTSFGIQSCLMLDLLHKAKKGLQQPKSKRTNTAEDTTTIDSSIITTKVPILWIDTGYLPHETYQFAEELEHRYDLDLHVYQSHLSPARMEALYGETLWETDHQLYNQMRKVEPMQRALQDTHATLILTGLRSAQTSHRQSLTFCNVEWDAATHTERLKLCPILDWTDTMVSDYFATHQLPYHPLYYFNYRSVGDAHSSEPYDPSVHANERDTRFRGKTQECGLHMSITSINEGSSSSTGRDALPERRRQLQQSNDGESKYDRHSWYDDYQRKSIIRLQDILHDDASDDDDDTVVPPPSTTGFTLYGRPKCRYCKAAKLLIQALTKGGDTAEAGREVVTIEVGTEADDSITKEQLEEALGDRAVNTVPQILYEQEYIGGYTDLVEWGRAKYSGNDKEMFTEILSQIVVE